MPFKRFHEWHGDLVSLTHIDTLVQLLGKDAATRGQEMQNIKAIAQGVLTTLGNGVSALHERDKIMFAILEPLFADRNRTYYEARAVFLRQLAPDQTDIIDTATGAALSFCDRLDNQTDEGKSYLEMQQVIYTQELGNEIDTASLRLSAEAASLHECAKLATARIDSLQSLMTTAVFQTLMQMPIEKLTECKRITDER